MKPPLKPKPGGHRVTISRGHVGAAGALLYCLQQGHYNSACTGCTQLLNLTSGPVTRDRLSLTFAPASSHLLAWGNHIRRTAAVKTDGTVNVNVNNWPAMVQQPAPMGAPMIGMVAASRLPACAWLPLASRWT